MSISLRRLAPPMDIQAYINQGADHYLPHLSIDIVIIGFKEGKLKVLLLELNGLWGLPGGHIGKMESTTEAALRILKDRTGLTGQYLKPFQVFGDKDRTFALEIKRLIESMGYEWEESLWLNKRFVSIAYYAFVDIDQVQPTAGILASACAWHDWDDLPQMALDHEDIIIGLQKRLKEDINLNLIAFNLLPTQFTMPQLHQVHEAILDKKLERSRFQKKMLSLGIFERLPKLNTDAPGRKPYLYQRK
ncbi:MAG: NUDIX domain-containing protein [Bacteroidota bacterium]